MKTMESDHLAFITSRILFLETAQKTVSIQSELLIATEQRHERDVQ